MSLQGLFFSFKESFFIIVVITLLERGGRGSEGRRGGGHGRLQRSVNEYANAD